MRRESEPGAGARRRLPTATLVLALLGAVPGVAQTAEPAEEDESGIRAAFTRYVEAVNAADWETVIPYYAEDPEFFWIEDGGVRYRSHEEVAEAFAGLDRVFESFQIELQDIRVVRLAPDAASVGVVFRQQMTTAGGTSLELEGAILATMVERDGAWKFLAGHTSTRRPPQPAAEEE